MEKLFFYSLFWFLFLLFDVVISSSHILDN